MATCATGGYWTRSTKGNEEGRGHGTHREQAPVPQREETHNQDREQGVGDALGRVAVTFQGRAVAHGTPEMR